MILRLLNSKGAGREKERKKERVGGGGGGGLTNEERSGNKFGPLNLV